MAKHHYIYVISAGDTIKIGRSVNPRERIITLQTGSPHKLELAYQSVPLTKTIAIHTEKALHNLYADYRQRPTSEWFASEPIINNIKSIIQSIIIMSTKTSTNTDRLLSHMAVQLEASPRTSRLLNSIDLADLQIARIAESLLNDATTKFVIEKNGTYQAQTTKTTNADKEVSLYGATYEALITNKLGFSTWQDFADYVGGKYSYLQSALEDLETEQGTSDRSNIANYSKYYYRNQYLNRFGWQCDSNGGLSRI